MLMHMFAHRCELEEFDTLIPLSNIYNIYIIIAISTIYTQNQIKSLFHFCIYQTEVNYLYIYIIYISFFKLNVK